MVIELSIQMETLGGKSTRSSRCRQRYGFTATGLRRCLHSMSASLLSLETTVVSWPTGGIGGLCCVKNRYVCRCRRCHSTSWQLYWVSL
jgi:hypothetical protein